MFLNRNHKSVLKIKTVEVLCMSGFNQSRNHSIEQLLKEGYSQMADLNLSLATEAFPFECEACDCNESYISSNFNNER